jgi:hypothetical protein
VFQPLNFDAEISANHFKCKLRPKPKSEFFFAHAPRQKAFQKIFFQDRLLGMKTSSRAPAQSFLRILEMSSKLGHNEEIYSLYRPGQPQAEPLFMTIDLKWLEWRSTHFHSIFQRLAGSSTSSRKFGARLKNRFKGPSKVCRDRSFIRIKLPPLALRISVKPLVSGTKPRAKPYTGRLCGSADGALLCVKNFEKKQDGPDRGSSRGLVLDPYFSGTKLKWLLDEKKDLRKKAQRET